MSRGAREAPARLEKIVSGAQTGADRAALDVALEQGLRVGGWIPKGRRAEDGAIPDRYPGLVETESADPALRTRCNVRDSDATLVVAHGPPAGGSRLALEEARRLGKPVLELDLAALSRDEAAAQLREWLASVGARVLNVAGPRASEDAAIGSAAAEVLRAALPARGEPRG